VTLTEVVQLVRAALPRGRQEGVNAYVLPRLISFDALCAVEPWAKFVLAEEVAQHLWVAFIDEAPDEGGEHRSRLILVDDEIAEVLMDLSIHFRPTFYNEMQLLSRAE
jgi:hypothetical protein